MTEYFVCRGTDAYAVDCRKFQKNIVNNFKIKTKKDNIFQSRYLVNDPLMDVYEDFFESVPIISESYTESFNENGYWIREHFLEIPFVEGLEVETILAVNGYYMFDLQEFGWIFLVHKKNCTKI